MTLIFARGTIICGEATDDRGTSSCKVEGLSNRKGRSVWMVPTAGYFVFARNNNYTVCDVADIGPCTVLTLITASSVERPCSAEQRRPPGISRGTEKNVDGLQACLSSFLSCG